MRYPYIRMRRLRQNSVLRSMVRETRLTVDSFVLPYFVRHGNGIREPIASMPDYFRLSIDELLKDCGEAMDLGIKSVLLFGIPERKDHHGTAACEDDGIVQTTIKALKDKYPHLLVITDVCNCEYTDHGHCGPVIDGDVHNDTTVEILARQALSHAKAGCDMVAPSDMMDGRVQQIREILDDNGFSNLPILSYAAKYASSFYSPFRDAAGTTPSFGDRKSYQMDMGNSAEALREAALDIDEGADILMVKPALAYLDIVRRIKERFEVPVAAYNVSGEYSMVKAAAAKGWLDEECSMMEILTSIRRAGADIIISYWAQKAARIING
ncbi:porphobilinogen synthase [Chitinispirillales bacterium ANBcel5]|uniref:porphobilinogen synthase n=1 Tax=Cellulosispirillum alkaliphilum TaxID=3039283 RepID=UPI002A58AF25|nr:porphobilinogen synthase [Chitinispirillales bacterium ANBcel5]